MKKKIETAEEQTRKQVQETETAKQNPTVYGYHPMKKIITNETAKKYAETSNVTVELFNGFSIVQNYCNERYILRIWKGKTMLPLYNIPFKTKEKRDDYLCTVKEILLKKLLEKEKYRQKKKKEQLKFQESLKVDDILVTTWGYEQTNVDFYQVINISGTIATISKLAKENTSDSAMTGTTMPRKDKFVREPMRKKIGKGV